MTFTIWFFNKNHKHHHTAMTIFCLLLAVVFIIIAYVTIETSEIIALIFLSLGIISIASGVYYIIDKKGKNKRTQ